MQSRNPSSEDISIARVVSEVQTTCTIQAMSTGPTMSTDAITSADPATSISSSIPTAPSTSADTSPLGMYICLSMR